MQSVLNFHVDKSTPSGPQWIFVFGSNLSGRHGKGAALAARNMFGAEYGVGSGRTGRSYALPTKDRQLRTLPVGLIKEHVAQFLDYACTHPEFDFFVTRVGCELAGYRDEEIAPLFASAPANCSFAECWRAYL